jgi:hypothetical protein
MAWQIRGEYMETCSCDYICPCPPSNLTARPTQGWCIAAFAEHIEQGRYNDVSLDGLNFVIVVRTPEEMGKGNWTVGLIIDDRATPEQQQALVKIASGQEGGPIAPLGGLISNFAGVETQPIRYEKNGLQRSVSVPGMLNQAAEAMIGANGSDPVYVENVAHPVTQRLALAYASRSHLHAFGIDWDNTSGKNNGHFAPFEWRG